MDLIELASNPVVLKSLETLTKSIYELGKSGFNNQLKKWTVNQTQRKIASKYRARRMVKTIWQIDKEVDLVDFYCPSRLIVDDKRIVLNDLDDFPYSGNLIVQGTVGQGKSILFRYLTSRELIRGRAIPLFLELRRITETQTLCGHAIAELMSLGFDADEKLLLFLAETGKVILFLDAFDEVKESHRGQLITEIEQLARRYDKLRILISSRPNSGIANSPEFRVFQLSSLQGNEYEDVVRRIAKPQAVASKIIEGVKRAGPAVRQVLDTPLIVALLVFRYNVDQSIPENTVAFYDDLFDLLLRRHDRSKAGYVRPRVSGIGDAKLHDVFNATSFLTRKADQGSFSFSQLQAFVQQALELLGGKFDAAAVLRDIIDITCLLLEEGGECRFLHRSVQEFHAARFIATRPEEIAIRFYETMLQRRSPWYSELEFLEVIDRYRFLKYFSIPDSRRTLDIPNDTETPPKLNISSALLQKVFGEMHFHFMFSFDKSWDIHGSGTTPSSWALQQVAHALNIDRLHNHVSETIKNFSVTDFQALGLPDQATNKTVDVQFSTILNNPKLQRTVFDCFAAALSQVHQYLMRADAEIHHVNQSASMFDVLHKN